MVSHLLRTPEVEVLPCVGRVPRYPRELLVRRTTLPLPSLTNYPPSLIRIFFLPRISLVRFSSLLQLFLGFVAGFRGRSPLWFLGSWLAGSPPLGLAGLAAGLALAHPWGRCSWS